MEALGLHIDGQTLKIAHVKKQKNRLKILAVESLIVPDLYDRVNRNDTLEVTPQPNSPADSFGELGEPMQNPLGLDSVEDNEENDILDSLVGLLRKYPVRKAPIAMTLPESLIHYTVFKNSDRLKGKKLRRKLQEAVSVYEHSDSKNAEPHYIDIDSVTYVLLNHPEAMPFLESLLHAKPLIDRRMTIPLITTPGIALAHLTGVHNGTTFTSTSVLVHIGSDFVRIHILQNGVITGVSPVISTEYSGETGAQDFLDTIYAKILFELDQIGVIVPDELFLSEEKHSDRTLPYLKARFPETPCTILTDSAAVDTSLLEPAYKNEIASYAVPIGVASGILSKRKKQYAHANFVPKSLKKEQSSARLAWHGSIILLFLFFGTLFYTYQWHTISNREEQVQFSINLVENELVTEKGIAQEIAVLEEKTNEYRSSVALVDSLWYPGPLYSGVLYYMSQAVRELNSLWIERLIMNDENFQLSGTSVYRSRIHRVAERLGTAVIKTMQEEYVRGYTIYNFELSGDPQRFVPGKAAGSFVSDLPVLDENGSNYSGVNKGK